MATEPGAAPAVGMPQLDTTTFANQIFWLLIALAAIYWILTRIALPRIEAILTERKGTITNDLLAAEDLKGQAKAAEAAYNEVLAKARAEANRIVAETRAAIQRDLDAAIAAADADIAARTAASEARIADIRATAMDSVTRIATDAASELVAVLGGQADDAAVAAAVATRLKG